MFERLRTWVERRRVAKPPPEVIREMFRYPERISDGRNNNMPERFGRAELLPRSELVCELITDEIGEAGRILELGPSVGRNLNFLYRAGFRDLHGIEINPQAVDLMGKTYPEIDRVVTSNVRIGAIEDELKSYPDGYFDVVFSLSTLQVVHDACFDDVAREIVRTTRRAVVTIEDEHTVSDHHFPRNYQRVFQRLGLRQMLRVPPERVVAARLIPAFEARVFRCDLETTNGI